MRNLILSPWTIKSWNKKIPETMALSNFEKHKLNFVCLCFYHHHHHHHFMGTNMCQMRGGWENNEDKYLVQDMRQYEQMMRMYVSSQGPRPGFMTQVNNVWNLWVLSQKKCKNNRCCLLVIQGWYISRVRRVFQLRVGSGLGIEKIFRVGSGWVPGICIKYQVNWVLWGIEILIGYSLSISLISYTF